MPLLTGWYDGQQVLYVTTDVSDATVAAAKGANFAPLLANAVKQPGAVDKVYAIANFDQASVFASAPEPAGASNQALAYTPLWRLVKVTWIRPVQARTLRSEEGILAAADSGDVRLEMTDVVLNCPIVQSVGKGTLPGLLVQGVR